MRYMHIESGIVINAIEVDDPQLFMGWQLIQSDTADIGDLWNGAAFTAPPPAPEPVPQSVSPRQIRQALTRAGLRASVEAAVAAGDQDLKDWWEFSTTFERVNPQVTAMGAALGVTEQQLDDLWTLAGSL